MKPVFADAYYFFALLSPRDEAHGTVTRFNANLRNPVVTSAWVLTEVADGLAGTPSRPLFRKLLDELRSDARVTIVEPSGTIFEAGVAVSGLIFIIPVFLRIISRRYRLTSQRLFIERGILSQTIDQTELIRVDDVRLEKTLLDRVFGLGTVSLLSTDVSDRLVVIEGVNNAEKVAESVRTNMRTQRSKALFVENL